MTDETKAPVAKPPRAVELKADLYTGAGHAPFPCGSTVTLEADHADALVAAKAAIELPKDEEPAPASSETHQEEASHPEAA